MTKDEPHKDGFLLMHADLPRQLAWAPHPPEEATASGYAEAYGLHDALAPAREEALSSARDTFEAAQAGNIEDEYESLEDVPRDEPMLARVFANGNVFLYHLVQDQGEAPVIAEGAKPDVIKSMAEIYDDFGIKAPEPEDTPEPGC